MSSSNSDDKYKVIEVERWDQPYVRLYLGFQDHEFLEHENGTFATHLIVENRDGVILLSGEYPMQRDPNDFNSEVYKERRPLEDKILLWKRTSPFNIVLVDKTDYYWEVELNEYSELESSTWADFFNALNCW